MKNARYYFRGKPGDEERMFRGVDCEPEGLFSKLRRIAFDETPIGFLVDHHQRPHTTKHLADCCYMTNGRFDAIFQQLHERQIVQTVDEYERSLGSAATTNKRTSAKLVIFRRIRAAVAGPFTSCVYLIPPLVDDELESIWCSENGKKGGNPNVIPFGGSGAHTRVVKGVVNHPAEADGLSGEVRPQILESQSEVRVQKSESPSSGSPESERDLSLRARETEPERPMSLRAYATTGFKIANWQRQLPAKLSEEDFAARFEAEFQMTWPWWNEVKRLMELSIPKPCKDGHHVFEGSNTCLYCPELQAAEEA